MPRRLATTPKGSAHDIHAFRFFLSFWRDFVNFISSADCFLIFPSLSDKEGDKICIFGFSRGAYTARALAGMIHKVRCFSFLSDVELQSSCLPLDIHCVHLVGVRSPRWVYCQTAITNRYHSRIGCTCRTIKRVSGISSDRYLDQAAFAWLFRYRFRFNCMT